MNNALLVDVVQPLADLFDNRTHLRILHPAVLPQQTQQLSVRAVLHQQVHVLFVTEVAVEGRDVAMGQVEIYAQLSRDLVLVALLPDLLLRHYLQAHQKTCLLVLH